MECSAVILVKNEAYWLPYTLTQLEGHFDSYVIYDVGSTDGTDTIIKWWVDRMQKTSNARLFLRLLPHVTPEVQGAFRNSMIVEGQMPYYYIVDGDELYTQEALAKIPLAVREMQRVYRSNPRKKYGVVQRVEVNEEITQQYTEKRSHHRLYHHSAYWTRTHPGERAAFRQTDKSEIEFPDITCWHMHNTLRSPKEEDALKRVVRKGQKTYHPGEEMSDLNLLDELPMLRKPLLLNDEMEFVVSPALAALQEAYNAS